MVLLSDFCPLVRFMPWQQETGARKLNHTVGATVVNREEISLPGKDLNPMDPLLCSLLRKEFM